MRYLIAAVILVLVAVSIYSQTQPTEDWWNAQWAFIEETVQNNLRKEYNLPYSVIVRHCPLEHSDVIRTIQDSLMNYNVWGKVGQVPYNEVGLEVAVLCGPNFFTTDLLFVATYTTSIRERLKVPSH